MHLKYDAIDLLNQMNQFKNNAKNYMSREMRFSTIC